MSTFSVFFNPGRELDRFTGKLIQSPIGEFWGVTQAILLENYYVTPQNWNFEKKNWMIFPVKRPVWRPGKWIFQKNFWMSFPWFANKG